MAGGTYKLRPAKDGPEFEMAPVEVVKSEESWTKLYLEDGTVLKMKFIVSKVARSIDKPVPGTNEPLYYVESGNLLMAEVPESLRFKVGQ